MYAIIGTILASLFFIFNVIVPFSDRLRGWVIANGILPMTDLLKDLNRGFKSTDADSMWLVLFLWIMFGTLLALIILLIWPILPFVVVLVYSANRKFIRK